MNQTINIKSKDYWFKVVGMLQQNWALIDADAEKCIVYFIGDTSSVFDQIKFDSEDTAQQALSRNGFTRLIDDKESQNFLAPPTEPFYVGNHPNAAIYSSRRFWK